ncbi:DsbE family thiol:disulfide interchange protein [Phyllobacterium leguminum]|uniref:Cytochrome c biogenesis protein CcmG/thiol:disulfide interchange protein DsbE n=1 Tax=Phyllobacterium leguminum TaxID=314237 RepID=A0A318T5B0_9HYPH|nr:DsbE family thiol:disulfide interchange protein [Phyllobacterium leguminum]PYE89297.1 cytochrome c biogenesis protein CcmG/thiol:disulfide interchange protein DsbE [Phyllobacterium leguminum]
MSDGEAASPRRRLPLALLPLAIFLALAAIFTVQLLSGRDESVVPSALIGKPAPIMTLPPVDGLLKGGKPMPGLDPAAFAGQVTLVNVWASWCVPCRVEHPLLMQLAKDERIRLVGLNYKDKPENARGFLDQLGNPFSAVGTDATGRAAIEWGVYGVPETFLVGRDGRIIYKHVGPFDPVSIRNELMPIIEKAIAPRG